MSTYEDRLKSLREELVRKRLDGFVVPQTDEYLSEYIGDYAQRLAWLTGFRGSAGTAVVLTNEAAIFIDGRYTLQVREQVDGRHWSYESVLKTSVAAWLRAHTLPGAHIGYDPWLHTGIWVTVARVSLAERGAELIEVESNPVDSVWFDRPPPSAAKLVVHPEEIAGKSSSAKRSEVAEWLTVQNADLAVLSSLDSIAWIFNVRGNDVRHTPVAFAYALLNADGTADLFVSPEKLTEEVAEHLGPTVRRHPRDAFVRHLRTLADRRVVVDPERAVAAIFATLEASGANVIEARDPVVLPKAIKNATEIAGHAAAQARDGAALSRFLHWLSIEAPKGNVTELSAAARLREFREETGKLLDLSFDTISGFGPNGAVVHYSVTEGTSRPLLSGSLYLVDSGGQYIDGTTDVTRTVIIGEPAGKMREHFTRVLKGHISLARATFPAGTRGSQLDILARQYLWDAGLDYAHGTGHGVGSYLGVHEGPQRIAHTGHGDEPLAPGMIISNEPGYYKAGEYGIRIENLMLVVERGVPGGECRMLGFEMLTFAPIDRRLIDVSLLTVEERAWIDSYHGDVASIVGPQLEAAAKAWLLKVTQPLQESSAE